MKKFSALLGATMLAAVAATPAQALKFNLIDTGGTAVGTVARGGFEAAASYWSSVFTDDVTINLNIGFSQLGPNILGSTGSARSLVFTEDWYGAAAADITSTLDTAAVANLRPLTPGVFGPGAGAVTAVVNAYGPANKRSFLDTATRIDNDGSINNLALAINKSTAKALGFTTDANGAAINYATADGSITFSNQFAFDFNPRDGITAGSFDFIGVAIHEIGHALGFVSGVDTYDFYTRPGNTASLTGTTGLENSVVSSSLDLFRYGSAGVLDWSTQSTPYFSIDGGVTQLFGDSRFSTGAYNGDGRQASHWKDSPAGQPQLGILDPTSGRGQMQAITALDLAAFDAIGYNVKFDVLANSGYRYNTAQVYSAFNGVPEPMSWALMIGGFGVIGAASRRRRVAFAA